MSERLASVEKIRHPSSRCCPQCLMIWANHIAPNYHLSVTAAHAYVIYVMESSMPHFVANENKAQIVIFG